MTTSPPDPAALAKARRHAELYLLSALGRFDPWEVDGESPQRLLIRGARDHRVRIYRGGNRTGKTTVGSVDSALRICDWHPFVELPPRGRKRRAWIVGVDWEHGIGEIIWPELKRWLPEAILPRRNITWYKAKDPEIPKAAVTTTGWRIDFKSAEAGRSKFQGAKLDLAWIDEEVPGDIAEEIRARLVDRGGSLLVTETPLAGEQWLLELEEEERTQVVTASMSMAAQAIVQDVETGELEPMLDQDAVSAFLDELPENQRKVRDLGEPGVREGRVYKEWSPRIHVLAPKDGALVDATGRKLYPWPIPRGWPRFAAIDFGYANPCAVVVCAEDPASGTLIAERGLYASSVRASAWARILKGERARGRPRFLPNLATHLIADHQADERAELMAAGIPTQPARKDVVPGLETVERYLHVRPSTGRPKLYVVVSPRGSPFPSHPDVGRMDLQKLAWELGRYRYPERGKAKQDGRDLPLKRDDHAADALRYLLAYHERVRGSWRLPATRGTKRQPKVATPTRGAVFGASSASVAGTRRKPRR